MGKNNMMGSGIFVELLENMLSLIKDFEEGDVLTLSDIKIKCVKIVEGLSNDKNLFDACSCLPDYIEKIAKSGNQSQPLQVISKIITDIIRYDVLLTNRLKKDS